MNTDHEHESEQEANWLERVKNLIAILEGSTISELELTEAGTEIIIRRQPGMMMVPATLPANLVPVTQPVSASPATKAAREDQTVPVVAPLTGVYYSSPSPTSPPFVSIGDTIHVGQVVALIEAMKVFNEIQSEVSGRVVKILATSGAVVQKGEALLRVEPL
ncbi:MAG TPA: biotin/lipoyl-containing protein [Ktedonobacteraceae bacterium]|nr:biotin/lipoyl-containing protein [Ktedonobacteraceae bacterium]